MSKVKRITELMQLIDPKGKYKSFPLTLYNPILHSGGQVKIELFARNGMLIIKRRDKAGNLHSSQGPADVEGKDGLLWIYYYKHGVMHAVNRPSFVHRHDYGWVITYEYRVNGKLHNENGPAYVEPSYMCFGSGKYFLNGVEYTEEEHRAMTVVSRHRELILALLPQPIAEEMIDAM